MRLRSLLSCALLASIAFTLLPQDASAQRRTRRDRQSGAVVGKANMPENPAFSLSLEVRDSDGDGHLAVEEFATAVLTVTNLTDKPATNVSVQWTISYDESSAELPLGIASGEFVRNITIEAGAKGEFPFEFRVLRELIPGEVVLRSLVSSTETPKGASIHVHLPADQLPAGEESTRPKLEGEVSLKDANDNGIVEPGEEVTATVTIRNTGVITARGLSTKWTSAPTVSVDYRQKLETKEIRLLAPGEERQLTATYRAARFWRPQGLATLTVDVIDEDGLLVAIKGNTLETLAYRPPEPRVVLWQIASPNNRPLAPGQEVDLTVWVQNEGPVEATETRVEVFFDDGAGSGTLTAEAPRLDPGQILAHRGKIVIPADVKSTQVPIFLLVRGKSPEQSETGTTQPAMLQLGVRPTADSQTWIDKFLAERRRLVEKRLADDKVESGG